MKNYLYLILAVSVIFTSCKKEEDENPTPTVITGCTNLNAVNYDASAQSDDGSCIYDIFPTPTRWIATNVIVDTSSTISIFGIVIDSLSGSGTVTYSPSEAESPSAVEFNSNTKLIFEADYDNAIDTLDYMINGTVLYVYDDFEEDTLELNYSVGENGLTLNQTMAIDTTFIDDGIPIGANFSYSMTLYFVKSNNFTTNLELRKNNNVFTSKNKLKHILKKLK